MTLYYDVTELSTALKPWVLERMLADQRGPVLYLDPDCVVFAPLDLLVEAALDTAIVLTPHLIKPMPRDGLLPDERHILSSGVYNLGFVGLGRLSRSRDLVEFWKTRLRYDAIVDHERMLFTDQRWIDLVPGMFEHHIERDPGCNVAYWNAHERDLVMEGDEIRAGEHPLRFFHFSGFDPNSPELLSKYSFNRPRLLLSEQPVIRTLCRQYSEEVHAQDFDGASSLRYWWTDLPNGVRLSPFTRRVLRELYVEAEEAGTEMPPTLTEKGGVSALMSWLLGHTDDGEPRFPNAMLRTRPALAASMAQPWGIDATAFAHWLRTAAPHELDLDRRLADGAARSVMRAYVGAREGDDEMSESVAGDGGPTVELIGFANADVGAGEATRRLACALSTAGIDHGVTSLDRQPTNRLGVAPPRATARPHDIRVFVNVDFDPLPRSTCYRIGYWSWEESPADLHRSFEFVNEVWCPSEFSCRAVRRRSPVPVMRVPMPFVEPSVDRTLDRSDLGLPAGFLFMFVLDFLTGVEQSNPLGLIDAFSCAFAAGEGPSLVIASINGEHRLLELERLRLAALDRPDIVVLDRRDSPSQLGAMIATSNCYVSLHRSLGLGSTIADAMAIGVPVIATSYGGNLDYMDEHNSVLIPAGDPFEANADSAEWADPDLDAAAAAMRRMVDDHQTFESRAEEARRQVLTRFSPRECGRVIARRIEEIRAMQGPIGTGV